jgi:hypothetical protein
MFLWVESDRFDERNVSQQFSESLVWVGPLRIFKKISYDRHLLTVVLPMIPPLHLTQSFWNMFLWVESDSFWWEKECFVDHACIFSFLQVAKKNLQLALHGPNLPASLELCFILYQNWVPANCSNPIAQDFSYIKPTRLSAAE